MQAVVDRFQSNLAKCKAQIPPNNEIIQALEAGIVGFQQMLPIVEALRNSKLQKAHYAEIEQEIGQPIDLKALSLKDLLAQNILQHQQSIMAISV